MMVCRTLCDTEMTLIHYVAVIKAHVKFVTIDSLAPYLQPMQAIKKLLDRRPHQLAASTFKMLLNEQLAAKYVSMIIPQIHGLMLGRRIGE